MNEEKFCNTMSLVFPFIYIMQIHPAETYRYIMSIHTVTSRYIRWIHQDTSGYLVYHVYHVYHVYQQIVG